MAYPSNRAPVHIWRKAIPLLANVDNSIEITNADGIGGEERWCASRYAAMFTTRAPGMIQIP